MTTEGKIYTTNLWQTKGIRVYEDYSFFGPGDDREYIVIDRPGTGVSYMARIGRDAFFSLEEAQAAVEVERSRAISSAEKQIERLRKMEIKVVEEGA